MNNPILNSPYTEPKQHFGADERGLTDEILAFRRPSSFYIPIPRAKTLQKRAEQNIAEGAYGTELQKEKKVLPILAPYDTLGSTQYVDFLTSRPVQETIKSHVHYVVADTEEWEQGVAKKLEQMEIMESGLFWKFRTFMKPNNLFALSWQNNNHQHE